MSLTPKQIQEAHLLAMDLLLPEEEFRKVWTSPFTPEEIAEKFRVEESVVMVRAAELNMKSFN